MLTSPTRFFNLLPGSVTMNNPGATFGVSNSQIAGGSTPHPPILAASCSELHPKKLRSSGRQAFQVDQHQNNNIQQQETPHVFHQKGQEYELSY